MVGILSLAEAKANERNIAPGAVDMRKLKIALQIILTAAFLVTSIYSSPRANSQSQAGTRYYAETGYVVRGHFLDYWETHGGLPQQGYPISGEMYERSEMDGKVYLVQYFERAVFEMHPENKAPYDVLLSLIGAQRYKEKYPIGAPYEKPNFAPGSRYFPQTRKRVGGSFLVYWDAFGGLQQQGYPVSDEVQERSELDGQVYTVQYFERAVMEWHPGNRPPYDVLLSQLGRFRYDAKYDVSFSTTPRLIERDVDVRVVSAGRYLFYTRKGEAYGENNRVYTLYGYNLNDESRVVIANNVPIEADSVTSDGKVVVWSQVQGGRRSVWSYNLGRRERALLFELNVVLHRYNEGLAVDGDKVYYIHSEYNIPGGGDLYARTLAEEGSRVTGEAQLIAAGAYGPVAADGTLLWTQGKSLHMLKTDGGQEDTVIFTHDEHFGGYSVSGDKVAFSLSQFGLRQEDKFVYLYDIPTGVSRPISRRYDDHPSINGGKILWFPGSPCVAHCGDPTGPTSKLYDIGTGVTSTLFTTGDGKFARTLIRHNGSYAVAYLDYDQSRDTLFDLYVVGLSQ
jgi:hypothetical protein